MTTDLTKTFFDTFGIEKTCNNKIINPANCPINKMRRCCGCDWLNYPQITDRHYLELIRILGYFEIVYKPDNCEELKKYILKYYLNLDDSEIRELKHQVQAIFKGER